MSQHGTLEHVDGRYQLRYERHLAHPPEQVWRALIEPEELKHWFPAAIEGERKQGAKLRFVFEGETKITEGMLRVFDPPRVFEFSWDRDTLRFELSPEPGGSLLVFTTTFVERVIAARNAVGWHRCLDNLAERLGTKLKQEPWHTLFSAYVKELGPGEFPTFLKRAGQPLSSALDTPGLDGCALRGQGGAQIELLRASRDAQTPPRPAAAEEYLVVIEGRYELQLGGGQMVLESGMEFAFPEGFTISGKIQAGTRILRAWSEQAAK